MKKEYTISAFFSQSGKILEDVITEYLLISKKSHRLERNDDNAK